MRKRLAFMVGSLLPLALSGFIQPLPEGAIQSWKHPLLEVPAAWIDLPKCVKFESHFYVKGRNTIANAPVDIYFSDKRRARLEDLLFIGRGWTDSKGDFEVRMELPTRFSRDGTPLDVSQPLKLIIQIEHGRAAASMPISICGGE